MEHPWFQRLRRIRQLGLTDYVYPSATHSRFQHALGCLHLMKQAVESLKEKGISVTRDEEMGLWLAILLHDIGHGPFSHTLERSVVSGISHEEITLLLMHGLNRKFEGKLDTAIRIFTNRYPKKFLHQLVSSQLDMDRLDYLSRDSFFTGVADGVINTDRIINMLNVVDDELVVEEKGIYSVEKFLMARRMMYWQVYLHKAVLSADLMLINLLRRARYLAGKGLNLLVSPALNHFLIQPVTGNILQDHESSLSLFCQLDDSDILAAIKVWNNHEDRVLSLLSQRLINRRLFRTELRNSPFDPAYIDHIRSIVCQKLGFNSEEAAYLITQEAVTNHMYHPDQDRIRIRMRNGELLDVTVASDHFLSPSLSGYTQKYLICYPKEVNPGEP